MEKIKFAQDYTSKKTYPFPSEDINQSEKKKSGYFLGCANAMVSKFFNNKCAYPYIWGTRTSFSELRAYRHGRNSEEKYKTIMAGEPDKATGRRLTTLGISWRTLKILPQKIDVVMGYLQKIKYDINVDAIDYEALVNKKAMVAMAKLLSDSRSADFKNEVNQAAGRKTLQDTDPAEMPGGMQFNDPSEVDVASQMGMFFLEEEAAIQTLIETTQYESGTDVIDDLIKDDLITLAVSGRLCYTNPNTNIVMEDYVDVDMAAWPSSKYNDYRDITWAFEIKKYTISRLRQETGLSDSELTKIAKKYSSQGDGSMRSNFYLDAFEAKNNSSSSFGMNMMDQIEVDVAICRWIGSKNVNITTVNRPREKYMVVNKVDENYNLDTVTNKKDKDLNKFSCQTVYKASLVIGSDQVFDFGEDSDISFTTNNAGKKTPIFPYKFNSTGAISLVERCIDWVDDANLANYKRRVAVMKMPAPPNVFINRSALENMKIDGVTYKPQQLMKLLQDEGYLIGDSKDQWGKDTNSGRAITPIGTDLMQVITGWWEDMGRCIEMIEKVTGVNDVFAAQTPQRQTGLGVSNLLVQGTQNALTPLIKAFECSKEQGARINVEQWKIVASYMTDAERKKLSFGRSLSIVKIAANLLDYQFDSRVEAAINDDQKTQLLADIMNMRSAARQGGTQSMNENDYLVIESMIRSGKIKQAQLYTAFAVEKRKKEAAAEQQKMIQANGQQQQQSIGAKAQADQQTMQAQSQLATQEDSQKLAQEIKGQILLETIKGQNERQKIILENQLNVGKQSA